MANLKSTTIEDTGFLQLPSGTTAERPSSPTAGEIRFNTDTKVCEWYDDQLDAWFPTGVVPPVATGGDSVEDVDIDGVTYRIHSFTTVGESTFTVTRGGSVDYLIVAGGGNSNKHGSNRGSGGGGGAGGCLLGKTELLQQSYTVFVGDGGKSTSFSEVGERGENSFAFGFTAFGGGAGGAIDEEGTAGGSGGAGGTRGEAGGAAVPGQGNSGGTGSDYANPSGTHPGGYGGGGGGAGSPGTSGTGVDFSAQPGNGGNGISVINTFPNYGVNGFVAGGGGGSSYFPVNDFSQGVGGNGGGGDAGNNGVANTGSGAGAGLAQDSSNPIGGSGIVIIRYRIS